MEFRKIFCLLCFLFLAYPVSEGKEGLSEVVDEPKVSIKIVDDVIDDIIDVDPSEPEYSFNFTSANNTELLQSLATAEAVDVCFLVDITGSMGPYIQGVKQSIRGVVDQLTNTTDRDNPLIKNLRLSFVGYRDFEDDEQFQVLSFTPKVSKFLDFLNKVQADGGGDIPEDVFGGLEKVAEREWTENAIRVLFHMADAPCHHLRCGPETGQDPLNRNAEELFKPFRKQKVLYNFGQINTDTQPMIQWFQEAYGEEISVFDLGFAVDYFDGYGSVEGDIYSELRGGGGGGAFGGGGGGGGGAFGGGGSRGPAGPKGSRKGSKAVGEAYLGAILTSIKKGSS